MTLMESQQRFVDRLVEYLTADYSESQTTILITGPCGCGKRTIVQSVATHLDCSFHEIRTTGVPSEIVIQNVARWASSFESHKSAVLYLSGIDDAATELIPYLHQLAAYREYNSDGNVLPADIHFIAGLRLQRQSSVAISQTHWLCKQFNHEVEIYSPTDCEHSKLLSNLLQEEGWNECINESLANSLFNAFSTEDWGVVRKLITRIVHTADRSEPLTVEMVQTAVRNEMADDLRFRFKTVRYRGQELTVDAVHHWVSLFAPEFRSAAMKVARAVCSEYFVGEEMLYLSIEELIKSSGTSGCEVVIGSWQAIEKSANYILNPIKNQANWKVVGELTVQNQENWTDINGSTLVLVDNFVGTGRTLCRLFRTNGTQKKSIIDCLCNFFPDMKIKILIVAGFEEGIRKAREFANKYENVSVFVGKLFGEEDRCFSDSSRILPNTEERERFRECCKNITETRLGLNPKLALGYGKLQSLVVLKDDVPNNTLPVIWKRNDNWEALFPADALLHGVAGDG